MCGLAHSKCKSLYDKLFIINIMKNKPLRWSIYCKRMTRVYIICTFISYHIIRIHRTGNDPNALVMPYFCAFIAVWSTFFLEFWKRTEKTCVWIAHGYLKCLHRCTYNRTRTLWFIPLVFACDSLLTVGMR